MSLKCRKNDGKKLSDRQHKILELVTDNPTISLAEMAEIIGVTTTREFLKFFGSRRMSFIY